MSLKVSLCLRPPTEALTTWRHESTQQFARTKKKQKNIQTKTTLFQTLKSIFVRIIRELSLLKKLNPCFIRLLETKRVRAVVCLFITTWAALYWEEKCLIYIEIEAEYFVNTVLKPHSMGIH